MALFDARQWCEITSGAQPPPYFPFTEAPGLNMTGNLEDMSPLNFFNVYFDDELIELICTETNRFAEQNGAGPAKWHPVSSSELGVFFALHILKNILNKLGVHVLVLLD